MKPVDGHTPSLSWSDYLFKVFPFGKRDYDDKRREKRERRRWKLADKDGNNELTKTEFKVHYG